MSLHPFIAPVTIPELDGREYRAANARLADVIIAAMLSSHPTRRALDTFLDLAGPPLWQARLAELGRHSAAGPRSGQALRQRHAIELTLDRLRRQPERALSSAEQHVSAMITELAAVARELKPAGQDRLVATIRDALSGPNTLVPLFHLMRTAILQRTRGFRVHFAGLDDAAPFDLLLRRDNAEAELACEVVSAEEGRGVHRGAWFRLADRIDPDLQTWLAAHPGRYVLKMTLANGLQGGLCDAESGDALAALHQRIRDLLQSQRRQEYDEAVVLRLDPLLLAGAQADELGLTSWLRREFGPEAHLSVTTAGGGVFVMAARAGRENEIAVAIRRRMAAAAPTRLSGTRPGILAMFVEDTDRSEWRGLRDRLELEGEARQFLANPAARQVVAVTCASRLELFGIPAPDGAADGDLRFRNPGNPASRMPALAPAVLSSV